MSENFDKSVILFNTTTSAIRSEKLLEKEGFAVKLISTPREFSSDCGLAVRIETNEKNKILEILTSKKIEFASVHQLTK